MERKNMVEDGQGSEYSFWFMNENFESEEDNSLSESSIRNLELHDLLLLSTDAVKTFDRRWLLSNFGGLDNKPLKHIVSFDERFFLGFLQLIHARASRVASRNLSSDMGFLSDSLDSRQVSDIWTTNKNSFVVECSQEAENEDWIVGSITGSKSMMNILKSPLLNRPGNNIINSGKVKSLDFKEPPYDLISSSLGFPGYGSKPVHRKQYSMSTTNSTCSDHSSFVATVISQGMLQITWENGLPHFVLSIDGKKEVYIADVLKVNSADEKCVDYLYTFRSSSASKVEQEMCETQPAFVGKMTVSTSFTLSPNKPEIMETLFVLYGSGDDCADNSLNPNHIHRKNKKLSKKVAAVFRSGQSAKQRILSKFDERTSAILEDSSLDICSKPELSGVNHTENQLITNFELAAIVVRSYLQNKKAGTGGWGLKFLKKTRLEVSDGLWHSSSVECSTTTSVIVPAGFHGGPITKNGGPTSLLDRWSSGGHCDCGGWDIGCPLTILNTRRNGIEADYVPGDCKTIDLFVQGSRQDAPILKLSNIRGDLFYIHSESNLSALQSFAIAAAIIHSHEPIFRSKLYIR